MTTDATEPNLLEETFEYSLPPRIRFDGPVVEYVDGQAITFDPADLKLRDLVITDTTFRDGQQSRPPYTIEQMVHIYDLLAKLGGPNGERIPATIHAIEGEDVILDFNHPLAGQDLTFEIELVEVIPSDEAEPAETAEGDAE